MTPAYSYSSSSTLPTRAIGLGRWLDTRGIKTGRTRAHSWPRVHDRLLAAVLVAVGAVGCATAPPDPQIELAANPRLTECIRLLVRIDQLVTKSGVTDVQAARIRGFPFLRVNRFLASYGAEANSTAAFAAWVERMRRLDQEGRKAEIANLPPRALQRAAGLSRTKPALIREVEVCGTRLQQYLLSAVQVHPLLRERAVVPTVYRVSERAFGLYPLSSLVVYEGVKRLQAEIAKEFSVPLDKLPVQGTLVRYAPVGSGGLLTPNQVREILARASANPLGIPEPRGRDRTRLLHTFAPVWEIDVTGDFDQIGTPRLDADSHATVDTVRAVTFTHISYARWHARTLLQLNYIVWFSERPRSGAFDLLGGRLDGMTWRVTLASDGHPLIYDAIHNCGCYHMFFPTSRVQVKPPRPVYEEPLLVPQQAPANAPRMVLRLATRTHYLQRVYARRETGGDQPYALRGYAKLRSLTLPDGSRQSLFHANGLVPSTERGERWLLWPMGVPEPGAMRQWGHHATAFVGRRHFDEPDLHQRYFDIVAYR